MTGPPRQITAVLLLNEAEVLAKRAADAKGEEGDAVLLPLRVPHQQVTRRKVEVLHAQGRTLEKPQARAVEELGHLACDAAHRRQHALHLLSREYQRHPWRAGRAQELVDPRRFNEEDVAVQEDDRAERLQVSGRAHAPSARQIVEERSYVFRSELAGMATVERDESANPPGIRLAR